MGQKIHNKLDKDVSRGFTLVELLIVIVVIAILAAISIVAYNGIQQRARNTQTMQAVNSYVKAFKLYQADNGSLPTDTGCLGANYPSNKCWDGPNGTWSVNSTLDSKLANYITTKPVVSTKSLQITGAPDYRFGALYVTNNSTPRIIYYLEGAGQVCISGQTGSTEMQGTQCSYNL